MSKLSFVITLALLSAYPARGQALPDPTPRWALTGSLAAGAGTHGPAARLTLERGDRVSVVSRLAVTASLRGPEGYLSTRGEATTGVRIRLARLGPLDLAAGAGAGLALSTADDGNPYISPLSLDIVVPLETEASLRLGHWARLAITAYRSVPTGLIKDDRTAANLPTVGQWGTVLGLRFGSN